MLGDTERQGAVTGICGISKPKAEMTSGGIEKCLETLLFAYDDLALCFEYVCRARQFDPRDPQRFHANREENVVDLTVSE